MRNDRVVDLAECTEFRQILLARPPRIAHGTLLLLIALLGGAILWLALTRADLVVRAPGRIRPVNTPIRVFNAGRGEVLSASLGGRVIEVNFCQGQQVHRGDVLVRLDAGRLDNEIARRKRTIRAGEEEWTRLARLQELAGYQFEAVRAKAAAELAQAREEIRLAKERQAADIRLAEVELESARDEATRLRSLVPARAVTEADLVKATARCNEAAEKLAKARLLVEEEGRAEIQRRALALAERDQAVKREELALKQEVKQGEVEAARLELANLELERRHADILAPLDGVVTQGDVKVGDLLEAGKPVVEIAEQEGFRFEATVPSEEVAHLRVGMPVRVKLDAYDYQKYGTIQGTVCFVSPDSTVPEKEKAPVHYVVRIELKDSAVGRGALRGPIKLGMAGQADIITDEESLLVLLVKKIRQTISLG
jgi:multidrug resistance efflux pump